MNAECGFRPCLTHRRTRDSRRTFRSEQTSGALKTHKHTQVNKRSENQNACLYLPKPDVKAGIAPNKNMDLHTEDKGEHQNQPCYGGNTHWFTWKTPGSNVSVVSLEWQEDRKMLLVNSSSGFARNHFKSVSAEALYPFSILSLRSWRSHQSWVTLEHIKWNFIYGFKSDQQMTTDNLLNPHASDVFGTDPVSFVPR